MIYKVYSLIKEYWSLWVPKKGIRVVLGSLVLGLQQRQQKPMNAVVIYKSSI